MGCECVQQPVTARYCGDHPQLVSTNPNCKHVSVRRWQGQREASSSRRCCLFVVVHTLCLLTN